MHVYTPEIQKLLDNGYRVRSIAVGRMGEIVNTNEETNDVYVRMPSKNEISITRFDKGDPVKLEFRRETNEYLISNED